MKVWSALTTCVTPLSLKSERILATHSLESSYQLSGTFCEIVSARYADFFFKLTTEGGGGRVLLSAQKALVQSQVQSQVQLQIQKKY